MGKQIDQRNKVVLPVIVDLIYSNCIYHFMFLDPRSIPLVHALHLTSRLTYLIDHWIYSLRCHTGISLTISIIKFKISPKPGPFLVFLIPVNDTVLYLVMQDRILGVILALSIFLTFSIQSITKFYWFNLLNIS